MKNKRLCSFGARDQQHEEKDGKENTDDCYTSPVELNSSEMCPICLNILTLEVGFPEDCFHAFCVSCILKWCETSTSCPVDRKPIRSVYKIDAAGGCTKIDVKARRQREHFHCICNHCILCYTEDKIFFRMDMNCDATSESVNAQKSRCIINEEKPDLESVSCPNFDFTGDAMASCLLKLTELLHNLDNSEVEEESEVCLMQRKRERLNHLRFPIATRSRCSSSISAETLIHSSPFLEEHAFPLNPRSISKKGFSKRTCVHSSVQEGTEKKQAASGTSNNRGTRKKPVQSSTRRRSSRNSKSDVSQIQSSPKSSNSDQESISCNTSSTNASSSEHPVKQPSKQRKRAPRKGPQTRKQLRSTTHKKDSSDSKDSSESETEQEEKNCEMPGDLSGSEQIKTNVHATKTTDKEYRCSDDDHSPLEQSDNHNLSVSTPMQNEQGFGEEIPASAKSINEHEFDRESISPDSKNCLTDIEDKYPAPTLSTVRPESDRDLVTKQELGSKHSIMSPSPPDCNADDFLSSPISEKHTDSEDVDLSSLSTKIHQFDGKECRSSHLSETELISPANHSISVTSLKSSQDSKDINQIHLESHESSDQSNSESMESEMPIKPNNGQYCPSSLTLDGNVNSIELEESLFSHNKNPEKSCDFEIIKSYCRELKEQQSEAKPILETNSINQFVPDVPLISDFGHHDKPANGSEGSLLDPKLKECFPEGNSKNVLVESIHIYSPDTSENATSPLEQTLLLTKSSETEELNTNILCRDNEQSPVLESKEDIENRNISQLKNENQVSFCEDNNESVAMECDSLSSDHNESEADNPKDVTESAIIESDSLASIKVKVVVQSPQKESLPLSEDTHKKESRARKSRFHSPSTTWSPTKNDVKERQRSRSRSKNRDSPMKHKSRSHSRDRDGDRNHGEQWKGRSRDRRHRRQSRSRSLSRSRSGSYTRNRNTTTDKNEKEYSSPPWKDRRSNDSWKSPRVGDRYRKNEREKSNERFRTEKYDARDAVDQYLDNRNDYPDWVVEKMKYVDSRGRGDMRNRGDSRGRGDRGWGETRGRGDGRGRGEGRSRGDYRGRGDFRGRMDNRGRGDGRGRGGPRGRGSHRASPWDDSQYNSGDSWTRNANLEWCSPRGRGHVFRGGVNYGDQNENWNCRQPYSDNSTAPGHEPPRFLEQKFFKRKHDDSFDSPADRSGWSSASSWAVRKTLPADVQNYYSKRGRSSTGSQSGWTRPEESQEQDQTIKDQPVQQNESPQMPVNMIQTQMNVVPQPMNAPPQPMNIFPYPVVHPPIVNIPHSPYNIHPQLPIHIHPALPLVQVSAPSSVPQGLPPPPPPPPPSQISYIASQQEVKPSQGNATASLISNEFNVPFFSTPPPAQAVTVGTVSVPCLGNVSVSSHNRVSHVTVKPAARKETVTVESSADSSKKEKKIVIQERAAQEVKGAIKQYYQNKDITKDEYKEIVKKAVDKVCHSKSGEVDSAKVANLVKAYVDKYKHSRKKGTEEKM